MNRPHRRRNPLTGEWILVSPQRAQRPWLGEKLAASHGDVPAYDPQCYLCPGNERAGGIRNPRYESVFVFDNDFAALAAPESSAIEPVPNTDRHELHAAEPEYGICRVLCFSPRHDRHLAAMPQQEVRAVVDAWAAAYDDLSSRPFVNAVTAFENRGEAMGASNPHPHGQVWAESSIPSELAKEADSLRAYADSRRACLLCDYAEMEIRAKERIVVQNEGAIAVVPFWAMWPFEILLLPRKHCGSLPDLNGEDRDNLARAMRALLERYDALFSVPFPYSMGFHQRPCDGPYPEWHVHAHYYPPLLRSATIRKYMVGYEMLAEPQRDFTPEAAAAHLRGETV